MNRLIHSFNFSLYCWTIWLCRLLQSGEPLCIFPSFTSKGNGHFLYPLMYCLTVYYSQIENENTFSKIQSYFFNLFYGLLFSNCTVFMTCKSLHWFYLHFAQRCNVLRNRAAFKKHNSRDLNVHVPHTVRNYCDLQPS